MHSAEWLGNAMVWNEAGRIGGILQGSDRSDVDATCSQ